MSSSYCLLVLHHQDSRRCRICSDSKLKVVAILGISLHNDTDTPCTTNLMCLVRHLGALRLQQNAYVYLSSLRLSRIVACTATPAGSHTRFFKMYSYCLQKGSQSVDYPCSNWHVCLANNKPTARFQSSAIMTDTPCIHHHISKTGEQKHLVFLRWWCSSALMADGDIMMTSPCNTGA